MNSTEFGTYVEGGSAQGVENTWVNLGHLEGEEVSIIGTDVDGTTVVYDDETVVDGTITIMTQDPHLHNFVNKAVIGLRNRYIAKPMRFDIITQEGTTKGSIKRFSEVVISLFKSGKVKYGEDVSNLHDVQETVDSGLFTGDAVVSHDGGYGTEDNFIISGDDPLPCVIRCIVPRVKKPGR